MSKLLDLKNDPSGTLGATINAVKQSDDMLNELLDRRDKENAEKPETKQSGFGGLAEKLKREFSEDAGSTTEPATETTQETTDETTDTETKEGKVPEWYHTLNEQQQAQREKDEAFQRQLLAEQAALKDQFSKAQQPRQQEVELDPAEFGYEDADQFKKLVGHIQKINERQMEDRIRPVMHQLAAQSFQTAVARVSNNNEHFSKYFTPDQLNGYFNNLSRQYSPEVLARINWDVELSNAYAAQDYKRLKAEYEKLQSGTKKSSSDDAERRANLKQVPKATQAAPVTKNDPWEEMHQGLPVRGGQRMKAFGARVKKHYGLG